MTQAKPTPGPAFIGQDIKTNIFDSSGLRIGRFDFDGQDHQQANANAALFAESVNVYHETQLTPRQLLEQRNELLALVKYAEEMMNPFLIWDDRDKTTWRKNAQEAIAKMEGKHD